MSLKMYCLNVCLGRIALLTFSSINIHFRFMENFKCLVWWMNFLIEQMSNLVLPGCIFILMMRRQMLSTYKLSLASLWLQPKSSEEQSLPVIQKNGKSSVLWTKELIPDSQNAEIIILMRAHGVPTTPHLEGKFN